MRRRRTAATALSVCRSGLEARTLAQGGAALWQCSARQVTPWGAACCCRQSRPSSGAVAGAWAACWGTNRIRNFFATTTGSTKSVGARPQGDQPLGHETGRQPNARTTSGAFPQNRSRCGRWRNRCSPKTPLNRLPCSRQWSGAAIAPSSSRGNERCIAASRWLQLRTIPHLYMEPRRGIWVLYQCKERATLRSDLVGAMLPWHAQRCWLGPEQCASCLLVEHGIKRCNGRNVRGQGLKKHRPELSISMNAAYMKGPKLTLSSYQQEAQAC